MQTGQWYQQPSLVTVIGKDLAAPALVIGDHITNFSKLAVAFAIEMAAQ